ncbi:MAG TPA: sulfotransferase domain-containing protein [Terriglobia bacterium]|nr:sulfotransferase domain-containing protein [Terriglobia bacterium]
MSFLRQLRRKASRSRLRAPVVWLRHRGLSPRDVFVASYPRSGSTWLRFLLVELLTRDTAGFDSVNHLIPDIGRHRTSPEVLPAGGRLIKTHEAYRSAYRRAIYITRDVRDVVLSEFDYENARRRISEDFDTFLMLSLTSNVNGYGSWQEHVLSWLGSPLATTDNLLTIKFEDLRARTEETLTVVAGFLGIEVGREAIRTAITNNSVHRMREKEDQASDIDGYSPAKANGDGTRFVRSGSIGGWRGRLSESQVHLIEQYASVGLTRLGYAQEALPVAVGIS